MIHFHPQPLLQSAATLAALAVALPQSAAAQEVLITGKVLQVEGHETPACRRLLFKRTDTGANLWFRLPSTASDNGIMAVSLVAVATGYTAQLDYNPAVTSGCGTEPKVLYLGVQAN